MRRSGCETQTLSRSSHGQPSAYFARDAVRSDKTDSVNSRQEGEPAGRIVDHQRGLLPLYESLRDRPRLVPKLS